MDLEVPKSVQFVMGLENAFSIKKLEAKGMFKFSHKSSESITSRSRLLRSKLILVDYYKEIECNIPQKLIIMDYYL
jgi:hypothetical protein